LLDQLEALARRQPLLLAFEDAHWADATSIELLDLMSERIRRLPVLVLITFRPEFEPPWTGLPSVATFSLGRLAQQDARAMVERLAGDRAISAEIVDQIVAKADGIPLFIEELTCTILDSILQTSNDPAHQLPLAPTIPSTLQDSLAARLDRLGLAKEIAQIGAAIGRHFTYALLRAVAPMEENALREALARLEGSGLVLCRGRPPEATYTFKHVLVQDAAYNTLLREARRTLHTRIGETLETQFTEIAESQPEILAYHYAQAGLIEKAVGLWHKAGQQSLARSALVEAAEQFKRALAQIDTLRVTATLHRERINLQVALINPLVHLKGYAAAETKSAAERARLLIEEADALGESPEDPLLLFSVRYSLWVANYVAFNGDVVRELATQFLALAERRKLRIPLVIGHRLMGRALLSTGEIAQGLVHFERALTLYDNDSTAHRAFAMRFGQDVQVSIFSYRSIAMWMLGHYDAATADAEKSLKDARGIGHAATLMYALYHTSFTHIHCGNHAAGMAEAEELVALAHEKGSVYWKARGMINRGCVLALAGKGSEAVQILRSAIDAYRSTGASLFTPWYLSALAQSYAELAQFDDARRCIGEAIATIKTSEERWYEAEVNRIAGEILLKSSGQHAVKADTYFKNALEIARQQRAKSFELRAAISRARLWRDQGDREQALDLLTAIYGWFTEGLETTDLKEARALIEALRS
jgi:predicted ATPase